MFRKNLQEQIDRLGDRKAEKYLLDLLQSMHLRMRDEFDALLNELGMEIEDKPARKVVVKKAGVSK